MKRHDPSDLPQCDFSITIAGREWVCINPAHPNEPGKHWLRVIKPDPS